MKFKHCRIGDYKIFEALKLTFEAFNRLRELFARVYNGFFYKQAKGFNVL